jgi:hypothetical protein
VPIHNDKEHSLSKERSPSEKGSPSREHSLFKEHSPSNDHGNHNHADDNSRNGNINRLTHNNDINNLLYNSNDSNEGNDKNDNDNNNNYYNSDNDDVKNPKNTTLNFFDLNDRNDDHKWTPKIIKKQQTIKLIMHLYSTGEIFANATIDYDIIIQSNIDDDNFISINLPFYICNKYGGGVVYALTSMNISVYMPTRKVSMHKSSNYWDTHRYERMSCLRLYCCINAFIFCVH